MMLSSLAIAVSFEMLGYSERRADRQTSVMKMLFTDKDREVIREKNRLRTKKIADQYEIEMRRKGGEPIWVKISGVPIIDSSGRVKGIIRDHYRYYREQAF